MPWPTPMHMVARARRAPRSCSSIAAVNADPGAAGAKRVPEGDGPAVGVDVLGVVRQTEFAAAQPGPARRTPRSARPRRCHRPSTRCGQAACGWRRPGPMPITRGGTPTDGAGGDPGQRGQAVAPHRTLGGDQHGGRAVVDARRRSPRSRCRPGLIGGSPASASSEVSRGCSSWVDQHRLAAPLRDRAPARSPWASRPDAMALAVRSCERRANASWSGREMPYCRRDVLRGLAASSRCRTVSRHRRVDEPPADGGVVDLGRRGRTPMPPWE